MSIEAMKQADQPAASEPSSGERGEVAQRIRNAIGEVRRKSYPLADLIPMMQQAADLLSSDARIAGQAEPVADDVATIAGLDASASHLSRLFDEQLAMLIEVEKQLCVDGHYGPFEDGEHALCDRIRAHLAAFQSSQPAPQAEPDEYDIQVLRELAATLEIRSPERHKALTRLLAAAPQAVPPDQLADRCERWLNIGVPATNLVEAFEAGFRDAESFHQIGKPKNL